MTCYDCASHGSDFAETIAELAKERGNEVAEAVFQLRQSVERMIEGMDPDLITVLFDNTCMHNHAWNCHPYAHEMAIINDIADNHLPPAKPPCDRYDGHVHEWKSLGDGRMLCIKCRTVIGGN